MAVELSSFAAFLFLGAISRYPLYLFMVAERSRSHHKKDAASIGARELVVDFLDCSFECLVVG